MSFYQRGICQTIKPWGSWILAAALALTAYSQSLHAQESKGKQKMDMQHSDWKSWCLGRFVIDLPSEATLSAGNPRYDYSTGFETTPMDVAAFHEMLQKRHQELKAIKHRKAPAYLLDAAVIKDLPHSGLFTFYGSPASTVLVTLEAYKLQDGLSFKVMTEATPDRIGIAQKLMTELMQSIVTRTDHEIPAVPGFCFKNGFIPDNGQKHEYFNTGIRFQGHPDVMLYIDTSGNGEDGLAEPLLKRIDKGIAEVGDRLQSVHTLRRGDRKIEDMPGQELLAKGPQEGGNVGHYFRWEAIGLPMNSSHPRISIELSTANRFEAFEGQQASLSDKEALALWDQILHSFKLRPVTTPVKTSEAPSKVKLGTLAKTGEACPQSGMWESAVGTKRLLLRAGESVPSARVEVKLSVMQKLKGELDHAYEPTTWRLCEYTDSGGKPLA